MILDDAHDLRLNFSPPVAETGDLVILTLSGTDRFVGLTQWFAVLALTLATFGVARRIGLDRRSALWGASLVPLIPIVLAQSWTSFTDLVFGSFAVTAVISGSEPLGVELLPLGLAVGLAMGTKFLGPIFAPLFALILVLAQPARLWPRVAAVSVAGGAVASLWYLRTQLEAGDPVGNSGAGPAVARGRSCRHDLHPPLGRDLRSLGRGGARRPAVRHRGCGARGNRARAPSTGRAGRAHARCSRCARPVGSVHRRGARTRVCARP